MKPRKLGVRISPRSPYEAAAAVHSIIFLLDYKQGMELLRFHCQLAADRKQKPARRVS
jgi:hypothetical protein